MKTNTFIVHVFQLVEKTFLQNLYSNITIENFLFFSIKFTLLYFYFEHKIKKKKKYLMFLQLLRIIQLYSQT